MCTGPLVLAGACAVRTPHFIFPTLHKYGHLSAINDTALCRSLKALHLNLRFVPSLLFDLGPRQVEGRLYRVNHPLIPNLFSLTRGRVPARTHVRAWEGSPTTRAAPPGNCLHRTSFLLVQRTSLLFISHLFHPSPRLHQAFHNAASSSSPAGEAH